MLSIQFSQWYLLKRLFFLQASLVALTVKNPPVVQETWIWSLSWEDSPGEGYLQSTAIHCSILTWGIPWTQSMVGYSPWSHKELDTTDQLTLDFHFLACSI